MGDEIKVYLPRMVQPVLQLFMQDNSEQKLSTQKVGTVGGGGGVTVYVGVCVGVPLSGEVLSTHISAV